MRKHTRKRHGADARSLALSILKRFETSRARLDLLMEQALPPDSSMDPREIALTHALVYGVVRLRLRLDHIIGCFSKTPVGAIDPDVLNILRLAVLQIEQMDRIPPSAAVDTAVEIAKTRQKPWIAGFVNGLLRNMLRNMDRVAFPAMEEDAPASLALELSFPVWLMERWVQRLGVEEAARSARALNRIPGLCIRANTLRMSRDELSALLKRSGRRVKPTAFAPQGLIFTDPAAAVTRLPGFADGLFQVQDEAAQLVVCLLNPVPDERILDACAGLGGKTGHIAMRMHNRGCVIAADLDGSRLNRLQEEMKRLGIDHVESAAMDLTDPAPVSRLEPFDRILVDAPCSGFGVLKRNPDAKWRGSRDRIDALHNRQVSMLLNLARRLKPGGVMVYAVCSLEQEENETVIHAFLDANPDFDLVRRHPGLSPEAAPVIDDRGFLNTRRFLDRMDGFFAAALMRRR